MKILKNSIVISLFLVLINCNSQQNGISSSSEPKTNAEISVKEGGKWNNRKYEGGTFKNVQSLTLDPRHTDHSFDIKLLPQPIRKVSQQVNRRHPAAINAATKQQIKHGHNDHTNQGGLAQRRPGK